MFAPTASLCLLSVLLPVAAGAATAPRLALVIGNADYTEEASLVNTLNDARDMAERLEALGFEVMRVENASRRELARAANEFKRRLRRADDRPHPKIRTSKMRIWTLVWPIGQFQHHN